MLYSTPKALNPLIGRRTFGLFPVARRRRRGLGASGLWSISVPTQKGAPQVLTLYGPNVAIPLSSLGVDSTWTVAGAQTNPLVVSLVGSDGTRKTFTFKAGPVVKGNPTSAILVDTQTQKKLLDVPAGFKLLGDGNALAQWFVTVYGTPKPSIGVPDKPASDVWAVKTESVPATAPGAFNGFQHTYLDLSTGETFRPAVVNVSAGGGSLGGILGAVAGALSDASKAVGNALAPIADPLQRAVTIVSTGGISELVGAIDSDARKKIQNVVGGTEVGTGIGFVTSGFNPAGAVAGAVSGATSGITGAVQNKSAAEVLGQSIVGGAVSGATVAAGAAVAKALTPGVPPVITQGPVTLTSETAGSTLLPPSLSLTPSVASPPGIFGFVPTAGPLAPLTSVPLPPSGATIQTAGSTLLPPKLSVIEPPTPSSLVLTGPPAPISFSEPPIPHMPLPIDSAADQAGSTFLPPELSATGAPGGVPGTSSAGGSLLSDILNAGKVAVPGAISGYQIYKKLTTPQEPAYSGGGNVIFAGDPYARSASPAPKAPSYGLPILAGAALLVLMTLKVRH